MILSSLVGLSAYPQTPYYDRLKDSLKRPDLTDTIRTTLLQEVGYAYLQADPFESRKYFKKAMQICETHHWLSGVGACAGYIGQSYQNTNQFDSGFYFLNIAKNAFLKDTAKNASANLGVILNIQANIEKAQDKYQLAIEHYLASNEAIEKVESPEKGINLAIGYINIAIVFQEMEQYESVIQYAKKAIYTFNQDLKKQTDSAYIKIIQSSAIHAELCLADAYIHLNRLDSAKKCLDKQKGQVIQANNKNISSFYYTEIGHYYKARHNLDQATQAYRSALQYATKIDSRQMEPLLALADIAKIQKQYPKGIAFAKEALVTERVQNKAQLRAPILKSLAGLFLAAKQYREAALAFQQYSDLADSLTRRQIKIKVNEIENKYQNKQKADSILVLTKNAQMQQLALHKKQNQNIFILIAAILILSTAVLFYRNLRHKHLLLKKTEEIQHQHIKQLEKERQLIAAQSILQGQEQERSRLARDLHDGVGGLLSGVKLRLSSIKGNVYLSESSAQSFNNVITELDNSIQELRRVSHNMMPEALIRYGLKEALENYIDYIQSSGQLNIQLQLFGLQSRLNQDMEIIIYRIVQELLANIIKHANATHVLIQIIQNEMELSLTVEDDGKGFNFNASQNIKGAGLTNIQARVDYLNGQIDINTTPGQGCSVMITAPINKPNT